MPDGVILRDVPDDLSKDEILRIYESSVREQDAEDAEFQSFADEAIAASERTATTRATAQSELAPEEGARFQGLLSEALGVGEVGLQLATATAGQVAGGLAGLGKAAVSGGGFIDRLRTVAETSGAVSDAMTFQPRTEAGQRDVEGMGKAFSAYDRATSYIARGFEPEEELLGTGDVLATTFIKSALDLLPGMFGFRVLPKRARAHAQVERAREAGYTLQPSQRIEGEPVGTAAQRAAERAGGKAAVPAEASLRNQTVTNRLAARSVGLKGESISPAALKRLRDEANASFQALADIEAPVRLDSQFMADLQTIRSASTRALRGEAPPAQVQKLLTQLENVESATVTTRSVMDEVRQLRRDARTRFKSDDPEIELTARAELSAADALEAALDRSLRGVDAEAVGAWRAARVQLAKIRELENALTDGGDIAASALARARKKGSPLTGELALIADMATFFPRVMQSGAALGSRAGPGLLTLGASGAGAVATGNPAALLVPFVVREVGKRAALQRPASPRLTGAATAQAAAQAGMETAEAESELLEQ